MPMIAWIVLGILAGFIASKIVNKTADGLVLNVSLGIGGALVGGFFFQKFGLARISGVSLYSILVTMAGAVVVLIIFHAFLRNGVWRRPRSGWH
jgi:uncharacterized membrane protein YeaQ/YmgE (transglycosylase-associated protein family)